MWSLAFWVCHLRAAPRPVWTGPHVWDASVRTEQNSCCKFFFHKVKRNAANSKQQLVTKASSEAWISWFSPADYETILLDEDAIVDRLQEERVNQGFHYQNASLSGVLFFPAEVVMLFTNAQFHLFRNNKKKKFRQISAKDGKRPLELN